MKRRELLQRLAAAILLPFVPGRANAFASETPECGAGSQAMRKMLSELFCHHESACAVGREYLRLLPASEASAEHLLHHLHGADGGPLTATNPAKLRVLIREAQRNDFAEGRTVMVDGWVLSETEARLCALAALA
ncbi:hypothetical protein [Microvirga massiliensis]|uniref:hypothetical protein n=1 Tax=Microvirga massiliensis TaxID=1033741 RepID=UPI00062BD3A0|nr:hypothetical protein [Microvirga massiliensis]